MYVKKIFKYIKHDHLLHVLPYRTDIQRLRTGYVTRYKVVVVVFQGLGLLACSGFKFFLKLMNLFGQLVGLLGRGTGDLTDAM
jgi:hypothetical protein